MEQEPKDVVIARIAKARGIRGEVACDLETDFPERFASGATVALVAGDGSRSELVIERSWFHKGRVVLKFAGCDTRDAAEQLVGARLVIDESESKQLGEGEYYEYQLVGADVVTEDGIKLGKVARLIRTGGTPMLLVSGEGGREHLIPFADDICPVVELSAKRVLINAPEGLLDL